jgi:adenosylcobinamide kinase/adenosylcobinamide-phosphate guanylyltransferase
VNPLGFIQGDGGEASVEARGFIFITGGVRSGKSTYAERTALRLAAEIGGSLHYIATCRWTDEEMVKRIARHQRERRGKGVNWKTWEKPVDIIEIAPSFTGKDIVLLDCLTTLLNNELFLDNGNGELWKNHSFQESVKQSIKQGLIELQKRCHSLLIVSNEVLQEDIMSFDGVFTYGKLLGHLHQWIVQRSKSAYLVEAGIPMLMKGEQLL